LVRAAADGATLLAGAKEDEEIEMLRSLTGRSLSPRGDERSAWTKRLFPMPGGVGSRAAARKPDRREFVRSPVPPQTMISWPGLRSANEVTAASVGVGFSRQTELP